MELHPQALQKLLGLIPGQSTRFNLFLVERVQMLVQPAWAEGVPGVKLCYDANVDEPVHLDGFMEGPGCVSGNVPAEFRYFEEFLFALRIGFFVGQF